MTDTHPRRAPLLVLALALSLLPACGGSIDIDTIRFLPEPQVLAEGAPPQPAPGPRPSLQIDTNITSPGLFVREYRSESPYGIRLSHTDATRTFEELVLTDLQVTYADGEVEKAKEQPLPLRFRFRPHEAVNSTSRGITREELHVLEAELKGVIARDESFRIQIAGQFVKQDGEAIPFELIERFTPVHDRRTVSKLEAFQDV